MATNSAINSQNPIQVALGGTRASTLTANGILYGNTTSPIGATSVGMAGQVLTSNGVGMAPNFQNSSSGSSGWNLIQTQTASNSPYLQFINLDTYGYTNFVFIFNNIVVAGHTPAAYTSIWFSQDNGSTFFSASNIEGRTRNYQYNSTGTSSTFPLSTDIALVNQSTTGGVGSGIVMFQGLGTSGNFYFQAQCSSYFSGIPATIMTWFAGATQAAAGPFLINAIRFLNTTPTNLTSGTVSLYGLST